MRLPPGCWWGRWALSTGPSPSPCLRQTATVVRPFSFPPGEGKASLKAVQKPCRDSRGRPGWEPLEMAAMQRPWPEGKRPQCRMAGQG